MITLAIELNDYVSKTISGERGDTGEKGDIGLKGDAGGVGEKGTTGDLGYKGEKGLPGQPGPRVSENSIQIQQCFVHFSLFFVNKSFFLSITPIYIVSVLS